MPAKDRTIIHIRITPALRQRLKLAAVNNEQSMNEEVTSRLERSFELNDTGRDEALKLLAQVAAIIDGK